MVCAWSLLWLLELGFRGPLVDRASGHPGEVALHRLPGALHEVPAVGSLSGDRAADDERDALHQLFLVLRLGIEQRICSSLRLACLAAAREEVRKISDVAD